MFTMRNLRSPLWAIAMTATLVLTTGAIALAARPSVGPAVAAQGSADCSEADLAALTALITDFQARLDAAVGAGSLSAEVAGNVQERLTKAIERCAEETVDQDEDKDQDDDDEDNARVGFSFGRIFQACFSASDEREARVADALAQISASIALAVENGRLTSEQAAALNTRLAAFGEECRDGDPSFRDLFSGLFGKGDRSDRVRSDGDRSDRDRSFFGGSFQRTKETTPAGATTSTPPTTRSFGDRFRDGSRDGSRDGDGRRWSRR